MLRALQPSNRMYKDYVNRFVKYKEEFKKDTKKIMEKMVETDEDDFHEKFYARESSSKKLVGDECVLN